MTCACASGAHGEGPALAHGVRSGSPERLRSVSTPEYCPNSALFKRRSLFLTHIEWSVSFTTPISRTSSTPPSERPASPAGSESCRAPTLPSSPPATPPPRRPLAGRDRPAGPRLLRRDRHPPRHVRQPRVRLRTGSPSRELVDDATATFVSANVRDENGDPFGRDEGVVPWTVRRIDGATIGTSQAA